MTRRVKRQNARNRLTARTDAFEAGETVNLEIHRPIAIGDQMELCLRLAHMNAIDRARKQIHCRRAEQPELRGVERVLQPRLRTLHREINLDLLAVALANSGAQVAQREKQKPFRKRKV